MRSYNAEHESTNLVPFCQLCYKRSISSALQKQLRAKLSHAHTHTMPRAPLSTVPPPLNSPDYSSQLAEYAKSIIYRSPIPSPSGLPIYILSAAALPDAKEVHFDALLPYVLSRLPDEDELLSGQNYEIVFFAGGGGDGATAVKKTLPNWGWMFQAFQALSRALRKRLQKLYIVHERAWVRLLVDAFSTVASPKSSKKIVHGKQDFMYVALYLVRDMSVGAD